MTTEEIKKKIQEAEQSCVYEMLDCCDGGKVDVLVMGVYPKRNVKKVLKELGIEKYNISCDSVTYTIYIYDETLFQNIENEMGIYDIKNKIFTGGINNDNNRRFEKT